MFPEELTRQEIDRLLVQCGCLVQNRRDMNVTAGLGVAIREVGLGPGEADYLLFIDGKAAGVRFTAEQQQWLDAIKDHIASSLAIDSADFADIPFIQLGGLGRAYELFGDSLTSILEELNARLAA